MWRFPVSGLHSKVVQQVEHINVKESKASAQVIDPFSLNSRARVVIT